MGMQRQWPAMKGPVLWRRFTISVMNRQMRDTRGHSHT
jgi:hypothetical protein